MGFFLQFQLKSQLKVGQIQYFPHYKKMYSLLRKEASPPGKKFYGCMSHYVSDICKHMHTIFIKIINSPQSRSFSDIHEEERRSFNPFPFYLNSNLQCKFLSRIILILLSRKIILICHTYCMHLYKYDISIRRTKSATEHH